MNVTAHLRSTLSSVFSACLLAGCTGYTPTPFTPAHIDTSSYVPKVAAFVVVLDTSDSMNSYYANRRNFYTAKDAVNNMNQTIPAFAYKSALVGFGSGSIFNREIVRVAY